MIALNELVKNYDNYVGKYNLMGKKAKLDSIILLEKKFTKLQQETNAQRSKCNKLCSEVANKINEKEDTSSLIEEINNLDTQINKSTILLNALYNKINIKLSKLPSLPRCENVLNIPIKTTQTNFNVKDFVQEVSKIAEIRELEESTLDFLKSQEDCIFEVEKMPTSIGYKNKITILSTKDDIYKIYDSLIETMKQNAKLLIQKSIRQMKKDSAQEFRVVLSDRSVIDIRLIEEYYSREYSLKYHDSKTDMNKFLNQIDIYLFSKSF